MATEPEDISAALHEVSEMFAELRTHLQAAQSQPGLRETFDAMTDVATRRVIGADAVSLTTCRNGRFTTASASDESAVRADEIQYALGSGPCVDAIVHDTLHRLRDLDTDPRWPEFGRRVSAEVGMRSMLSYRLGIDDAVGDVIAGLNFYARRPDAFDDVAVEMGLLLATHGAMAVTARLDADRAANLEKALESNRDIGVAMGVLMNQHRLSRTQSFDLLRITSQHTNRKMHELAVEVGDTGTLPYSPAGRRKPPDGDRPGDRGRAGG